MNQREHSFQWKRRVEFCETDAAGIAHFSSFFLYMEQAEHAFLRSLDATVYRPADSDQPAMSWPRVRAECDYQSSVRFEEILEVDVTLKKLGTKSVVYRFAFTREGEHIATGHTTAVYCQIHAGRLTSTPIPEPLRTRMAAFVSEIDK